MRIQRGHKAWMKLSRVWGRRSMVWRDDTFRLNIDKSLCFGAKPIYLGDTVWDPRRWLQTVSDDAYDAARDIAAGRHTIPDDVPLSNIWDAIVEDTR